MKKIALIMMALALSANLVACGGAPATPPPAPTPAPAAPAPAAPAPATPTPAEEEEVVYELDYAQIATWVDKGFIGVDETDSPVVMAMDANNEFALIIFGDNDDMTAASVLGAITYDGDLATITDETTELALTFGVTAIAEGSVELDMGDIGKATITAASKEEVLETIKIAIDNYEHVA